jgi:hypothetical protein
MCLVGLLLLFASSSNAEMRKWTRKNGKEFEAEFVKLEHQSDGKNMVTLRKPDGSEMTVRIGNLGDEDRKYVKQLTKSQGKSETKGESGQTLAKQPATPSNAVMRKWTRKNGKEFEAEFVKRDGREVTLRKADGTEFAVKMGGLSDADRKYVKRLTNAKPAGKPEVATPRVPADTSVSEMPDQPPADSSQQRPWLRTHLLKDAQCVGTFDDDTTAKASTILQNLPDDQIALLCQYYLLTRSKTEQDAYIYSLQQQGYTDAQVNEAKAPIADLLTEMQNQGDACYNQIQTLGEPAQYLAQIEYASVPGWCVSTQCYVPGWYYDNGSFVGPCYNGRYCGAYAATVFHAYHDAGSRFYKAYHSVGDRVYQRHTAEIAQRSAKYFHEHDYRHALAHDRLLKPSSALRHVEQHDAHLTHVSEHSKALEHVNHGKAALKREHTQPAEHVEHGKEAAKPEHAQSAEHVEHGKGVAKTEHAQSAEHVEHGKEAAKPKHTQPAAKTEHAKPVEHAKEVSKTEHSKPAAKGTAASKPTKTETSKPVAKATPGGKPTEKPAPTTKTTAKPEHTKPAAKPAPASKPAKAETSKPATKATPGGKPAAKPAPATKPAAKPEHTKPAAKPTPASKPAKAETSKPAAKPEPASKPAGKQEKK